HGLSARRRRLGGEPQTVLPPLDGGLPDRPGQLALRRRDDRHARRRLDALEDEPEAPPRGGPLHPVAGRPRLHRLRPPLRRPPTPPPRATPPPPRTRRALDARRATRPREGGARPSQARATPRSLLALAPDAGRGPRRVRCGLSALERQRDPPGRHQE